MRCVVVTRELYGCDHVDHVFVIFELVEVVEKINSDSYVLLVCRSVTIRDGKTGILRSRRYC